MPRSLPSPETLHKLLRYNPETGALFWRARTPDMFSDGQQSAETLCRQWNTKFAGKEAFTAVNKDGYSKGRVFAMQCYAHRVIWAIYYGEWPTDQIDHINGVKNDNRIENLRAVTRQENGKNQKLYNTNTSGVTGVYWQKKALKWRAQITMNGRLLCLGRYVKKDDAIAARKAAELEHGFHVNHGRTL